ncbi:MAG: hypothetical protein ACYTG0_43550 [Planctomycetota bacterium]|jgi:hypothetical protein
MAASGISGKDGLVKAGAGGTQIAEITGWRFTKTSNNPAWASSDTGGYKTRVAGVKDGSGSIDFKYSTATAQHTLIAEGTLVTLELYRNASLYISVPAVIDSISDEVDINDGDTVSGSADFSITAAWSET